MDVTGAVQTCVLAVPGFTIRLHVHPELNIVTGYHT